MTRPHTTHQKAYPEQRELALWLVRVQKWSDTKAARAVGVHQTTVRAWRMAEGAPRRFSPFGPGVDPMKPERRAT